MSGVSILTSALGDRKDAVCHAVPLNSDEAEAVAKSYFKSCARRFVVGRGTAHPDAKLRVGALLDLKGLGALFSGKYYVAQVRHVFDSQPRIAHGIHRRTRGTRPSQRRS